MLTITVTEVLNDRSQGFVLHNRVNGIDETIYARLQDTSNHTLMIGDSGMPAHEEVIGALLKAHLRLGNVLDLIDKFVGEDDPFVGMMRDPKQFVWILLEASN